jgi:arsenate reductase (glutaredoxin)
MLIKLDSWVAQAGLDKVMNKKSTTWRGLDAATQSKATNTTAAISIMQQNNSLIKRPIIEKVNSIVAIGFNETELLKLV